jgi:hypothetical protein
VRTSPVLFDLASERVEHGADLVQLGTSWCDLVLGRVAEVPRKQEQTIGFARRAMRDVGKRAMSPAVVGRLPSAMLAPTDTLSDVVVVVAEFFSDASTLRGHVARLGAGTAGGPVVSC